MSEPTPPVLAGNWQDDDGHVIDILLDENTDGAKTPPPATVPFVPPRPDPLVVTRTVQTTGIAVSGTTSGTASQPPQLVLPADPNRIQLFIRTNALGVGQTGPGLGSDVLRWGDDKSLLASGMMAAGVTTSQTMDGILHTGAVFVFAPETNNSGAGGGMQFWITAVTK